MAKRRPLPYVPPGYLRLSDAVGKIDGGWPALRGLLSGGRLPSYLIVSNSGRPLEIPPHTWNRPNAGTAALAGGLLDVQLGPLSLTTGLPVVRESELLQVIAGNLARPEANPPPTGQSLRTSSTQARATAKSKAGRRANPDVHKFWIEIIRLVNDGELPRTKKQLTERLCLWAKDNMNQPYDDETIGKHIQLLWRTLGWRDQSDQ